MKVNTYMPLSQRTGEILLEPAQRSLALVDRVALLVRGLVGMPELDYVRDQLRD